MVYFDSQDRKQKRADDAKKPPAQNAADATRQMLESKVLMLSQNPHLWNMHVVKNLSNLRVYFIPKSMWQPILISGVYVET